MSKAMKTAMIMAGLAAINKASAASDCYPLELELHNEFWTCPKCQHEQENREQGKHFDWCGKNLKCPGCGDYSYYKEWLVRG